MSGIAIVTALGMRGMTQAKFRRSVAIVGSELARTEIERANARVRDPTMAIELFPDLDTVVRLAREVENREPEVGEVFTHIYAHRRPEPT
jgi:hypothetical protein